MTKIKVVSLNMWHGGRLWEPLVEFIRDQSADIYFFQEANNRPEPHLPHRIRTVSALKELFPEYYFSFSPKFGNLTDEFGLVPHGCLYMSRYALLAEKLFYFDVPYGERDDEHCSEAEWATFPAILQTSQVDLGNQTLRLGNLHGPVWYQGNEPTVRRQAMVEKLCDFASQQQPWLIAGDSNAQASNPVWQPLSQLGTSVFGTSLQSSFNMRHKTSPGYAQAAVDVCWVSPDLRILSHECPQVDISDHLPLIVKIEI